MLAEKTWPSRNELFAAIAPRVPALKPAPNSTSRTRAETQRRSKIKLAGFLKVPVDSFKYDMYLGVIDKRLVLITFTGTPNPLSWNESFLRSAWWWRSAYKDLASREAHVTISLPVSSDPKRDQMILAQLTAAVISKTKAIGVIWDTADAVYRAGRFAKMMDQAKRHVPPSLAVSVKLGRDTQFPRKNGQPAWLAATYGLRSLGLKEIEYRGYDGKPQDLVQLLWNISGYLIQHGDVIGDNDTMGSPDVRQYVFQVTTSTIGLKGKVLRMRTVPAAHSRVRPEDIFIPGQPTEAQVSTPPRQKPLAAGTRKKSAPPNKDAEPVEQLAKLPATAKSKASQEPQSTHQQQIAALPRSNNPAKSTPKQSIVHLVQARLKQLGCDVGAVDGLWGPQSQNALNEAVGAANSAAGATSENLARLNSLSSADVCKSKNLLKGPGTTSVSLPPNTPVHKQSRLKKKKSCLSFGECMRRCNSGELGRNAGTGCSYICGPEIPLCS